MTSAAKVRKWAQQNTHRLLCSIISKSRSSGGRPLPSCIELLEARIALTVFVVNTTLDLPDSYGPDGIADTTNNPTTMPPTPPSGITTLRAAIDQINFDHGGGISFAIGSGHQVIVTSGLPPIQYPVVIDGTTQPGYAGKPLIEIRGTPLSGFDGLGIYGSGSTVKGLVVNSFLGSGIRLVGSNDLVTNCYVGTDFTGAVAMGNGGSGIVTNNGSNDTIGGTGANERNLVSNNVYLGIEIESGSNNLIIGNYVGTDITGMLPMGNGKLAPDGPRSGIGVFNSSNNTIGGTAAGTMNLVADSGNDGIQLQDSSDNTVKGNFAGTDITGMNALGNGQDGIHIHGGSRNLIGDATNPAGRNLISGNKLNGVRIHGDDGNGGTTNNTVVGNLIGTKINGINALPNATNGVHIESRPVGNSSENVANNTIGQSTPGTRNIIAGNTGNGVLISGGMATGNKLYGNYIGLNQNGNALGNGGDGVLIEQKANHNNVGISGNDARNIISSNTANGVEIGDDGTTANSVLNNYIGTNAGGTAAMPNGHDGILIDLAPGNFIGDANEGTKRLVQGNLISGNTSNGVEISGATATGNRIRGNFIGANVDTTAALPNSGDGVLIDGAPGNVIGSSSDESRDFRNVISGNHGNGVKVSGAAATGTFIQGNFIGTDINGTAPFGNVLGNLEDGVLIDGAPNTTIGSRNTSPDAVISGNASNGVEITGETATGTKILIIKIGVDFAGMALGNLEDGVLIEDGSTTLIKTSIVSANVKNGIHITGNKAIDNTIDGCTIGVSEDGTMALSNHLSGVLIEGGASGNFVGTSTTHNIISANLMNGVELSGAGTTGNFVLGNYIGTDSGGTSALANTQDGVLIADGASGNTIGGDATLPGTGDGNVISGNTLNGVELRGANTTNNLVEANVIGTDKSGAVRLANVHDGILINDGADGNTIGGIGFGLHNIISGNGTNGIEISGDNTDLNIVQNNSIGVDNNGAALPNHSDGVLIINGASQNTIGQLGQGLNNIISGNTKNGVEIDGTGTTQNTIQNNYIGVDGGATSALPNGKDGVLIGNGADHNLIGVAGGTNIISGNTMNGVEIDGAATTQNTVQNNYIGLDLTAMSAIPNVKNGVLIGNGSDSNHIGVANGANIISGNTMNGVEISGAGTTLNEVFANFIGTDLPGTTAIANTLDGILVTGGAKNSKLGGAAAGEGNVVSGNGGNGIQISAGSNTNLILNNKIGTDATGAVALPNTVDGVRVDSSSGNEIGQSVPSGGNQISGNGANGVHISKAAATGNLIKNNFIGSDPAGTAGIPNTGSGVLVEKALNNTIGGPNVPDDNLIAFNGRNGVTITSGTGNRIQQNSIFSNTLLGIDLGDNGVTPNTPGGPHSGENHLQNYPVISSASFTGSASKISFSLNSTPSSTFVIELFSVVTPNASGFGEGKIFIASVNLKTNAQGKGSASITSALIGNSQVLTATATDTVKNPNDTSEFSHNATVTTPPPLAVKDVNFTTAAGKLTGVVLKFSQKLNAASVAQAGNLSLFKAGADKIFGTSDDVAIKLSTIKYDATKLTVTLTTVKALTKSQFIEVFAGGTQGVRAVTSVSGSVLDGEFTSSLPSGDGMPGGDFKAVIASGTLLRYLDSGADAVVLSLTHGGSMELIRTLDGEGRLLELSGVVAHTSVLTGTVTLGNPAPPADGVTTLQSVTGLGSGINHLPTSFVLAHPAS